MSATETIEAHGALAGGKLRAFFVMSDGERSRLIELPDGAEWIVGRAPEAELRVDSPEVSRQHARITRRGANIAVEDLGSRNGVIHNGRRLDAPARLVAGDELRIGSAYLTLGLASALRRSRALLSASALEQRLAAEIDRARRYRRTLGLSMVRLEGPTERIDEAVEALLARVRRMDEVAEYTSEELALVFPEAGQDDSASLAQRIHAAVTPLGVTAHVGSAWYPRDGAHGEALLSAARDALRAARRGGPPAANTTAADDGAPLIVDPQVKRLYENLARVAASSLTVLVLGETGVGKELAAEAVHRLSPRSAGPLVKINCASLPESLLESELFGYERGAFTGAARRKQGYFEAAHHGTLFLDEIGEMPLGLQAKLLRVLERRAIIRVGATAEVEVDVRIVAATNRDLEGEVARGAFREDLYYRVSGFTVMVPPLRDRPGEIVPLAQRFLRGFAAELGQAAPELSEAAVRALQAHSWPGNVRELRNTMERALALHTAGVIEVSHLSDRVREGARAPRAAPRSAAVVADLGSQVAALERSAIAAALESCGGNQTQAARVLGITRRALLYKLDKLGLRDGASR